MIHEQQVDAYLTKVFPPKCEAGYPVDQLRESMPKDQFNELMKFMNGQTMTICDGRKYDHEKKQYTLTHCGPHGAVIYVHDFKRFLMGWPAID